MLKRGPFPGPSLAENVLSVAATQGRLLAEVPENAFQSFHLGQMHERVCE